MKSFISRYCITLFALLIFSSTAMADVITVVGQKWLPFIGDPSTETKGYMVDVVKAVFEKEGHIVKFSLMPQKRASHHVSIGKDDIMVGAGKNENPDFVYPDEELGAIEDTVYIKKGRKWRFNGMDSLKKVRLGVLLGNPYGDNISQFLKDNMKHNRIMAITGSDHIKRRFILLQRQKLEVIIETPQVIRWGEKNFKIPGLQIANRGSIGSERPIFAAFSPKNPKATEYAKFFSKRLAEMRESGELKKILDKYNQRDWKPTKGKEMNIRYVQELSPISLDPPTPTDLQSFIFIEQMYDGLVRYKDESTSIEPALAVSWQEKNNGLTWIFNLRKGVKFHDGTDFNSKAVLASFHRQLDPKHPFYREGFSYASFTFQNINKVEALDEFTIKITLDKPYAPFIYNMAMPAAKIVSPTALVKYKGKLDTNPVGTGPFIFESWNINKEIKLKRNTGYFLEPPFINSLTYTVENDSNKILEGMKSGKYNVCELADNPLKAVVDSRPGIGLFMAPVMHIQYLMMNTEKKPFDNTLVRRAVNHAIDKEVLVSNVSKGFSIPAKTPLPPSMWGHNKKITDYIFSPEKAKELLAQAGYKNGFETELMTTAKPDDMLASKIIKKNLSIIGIKVNIKIVTRKEYFPAVKKGEHMTAIGNWIGDNGDPDNFLYVLFDYDNAVKGKASNRSFYKNDELHKILIKAQRISDRAQRTLLYEKAQEIIHADAPWVCMYHSQRVIGRKNGVRGVIPHPTGVIRFYRAWIDN